MSQSSRDVKKRLFEFAKKEFSTKSPLYVEVRKAKGAKTFYKGPVPQLILTKHKAILFTVFADYGSLSRLYYFNRDGYCIKDTSYSTSNINKIKTHLQKTTTRVLRYPKQEIKASASELSVELDKKFASIIEKIEKITKKKLESRPIITISSNLESSTFGKNFDELKMRDGFLELPFGAEKEPNIDIILIYEAFRTAINSKLQYPLLSEELAKIGTLLFLEKEELLEKAISMSAINSLDVKSFSKKLPDKFLEIVILFDLVDLVKDFIDYKTLIHSRDVAVRFIESIVINLFSNYDSKYRLATFIHRSIKENIISKSNEQFIDLLLITSCLENLSESSDKMISLRIDLDKKFVTKIRSKIVEELIDSMYRNKVRNVAEKWQGIYDLFSSKTDDLMVLVIENMFKKAISIVAEYTTEQLEKHGDIILTFKNNSDTNLGSFTVSELHWTPRDSMEIIGVKRRLKRAMLEIGEEAELRIPIIPRKSGTINFSNLAVRFNDHSSMKHYVRIPLPPLKIKK
ncbi:MAG: hypothetical protein ACTSPM_02555 [Candidatus Heimdallarchaeota archaeon]